MVLVGYNQEQHHSFRDFNDCEELRYLTLLVPLIIDKETVWKININLSKRVQNNYSQFVNAKEDPRFPQGFAHLYLILCSCQLILLGYDLACGTTT